MDEGIVRSLTMTVRSLTMTIGGVDVCQYWTARVANLDDLDVRAAFTFPASIGSMQHYEDMRRRGLEKAQIDWTGVPDQIRPEAVQYAEQLAQCPSLNKPMVRVSGSAQTGLSDAYCRANAMLSFYVPAPGARATGRVYGDTMIDGVILRIEEPVPESVAWHEWAADALTRLAAAQARLGGIAATGVQFDVSED